MRLTEEIKETLGIPIIQEASGHVKGQYYCFDDGSAEIEVLEFLYSLTRLMKPEHVLETGTYVGLSALYIAMGLKENNKGHIDTIEWERTHLNKAILKWEKMKVTDYISYNLMSSMNYTPKCQYDLMLLDTEPQLRYAELKKFWNNLNPGGLIVIHDLSHDLGTGAPQFWKNIDIIEDKLKNNDLVSISFDTPRGLNIFKRPVINGDKPDYSYKVMKGINKL